MVFSKKKAKVTANQLVKILGAYVDGVSEDFFKDLLQKLRGLINLSEEEERSVRLEVDIFILFSVAIGVQSAIPSEEQQKIDVSKLDQLEQLFLDRYASYYKVLREYKGEDSMFRLGKQFVDNALGGNGALLEIVMLIPAGYVTIAKNAQELIEQYQIVG